MKNCILFLIGWLMVLFSSCQDENSVFEDDVINPSDKEEIISPVEKPVFIFKQQEYVLSSNENIIEIELITNCKYSCQLPKVNWIVEESTITEESTYIHKLKVTKNNTGKNRSANIVFSNKQTSVKDTISVIQVSETAIAVAKDVYHIDCNYNSIEADIQSDENITIVEKDDNYMVFSNIFGSSTDSNSLYLYLYCIRNNSSKEKVAFVTLISESGRQQTIKIIQAPQKDEHMCVVLEHSDPIFTAPIWNKSYDYNSYGVIQWGDGTQTEWVEYELMEHAYSTSGVHTVTMDMYNMSSFDIEKIGSITSITVYDYTRTNTTVDNMDVNLKEWDK